LFTGYKLFISINSLCNDENFFLSFFLSFFLCAITLQAQITPEKPTFNNGTNAPESDFPSEFSCEGMIIHPNDDDFGDDPTSIGKILIWTKENDTYHTPYQVDKRVVKIEVKFPRAQTENTVYFRVIDYDDQSPYAINSTLPNINYEAVGINGVGLHAFLPPPSTNPPNPPTVITGGETSLAMDVNTSQGFKMATCYLVITDRYSGDNYKVEASLDPNFSPGSIVETSNLVAWKRAYVDLHYMWEGGGYVYRVNLQVENSLRLFDTSDFTSGDDIIIYFPDGSFMERKLLEENGVTSERLFFTESIEPIPEFAGVIKKSDAVISIANTSLPSQPLEYEKRIRDAFGYNGNGNDGAFDEEENFPASGGGFVEFKYFSRSLFYKGGMIPRFKDVGLNTTFEFDDFMEYWRGPIKSSTYFVVLGFGYFGTNTGISSIDFNTSFIASENIDPNTMSLKDRTSIEMENTFAHEFAHQFGISRNVNIYSHTDAEFPNASIPDTFRSNDTDSRCIMMNSFGASFFRNAEFCSHHNHGGGGEDNSCIEDIRKEPWPN